MQLQLFDRNKDGKLQLSEMAKWVSIIIVHSGTHTDLLLFNTFLTQILVGCFCWGWHVTLTSFLNCGGGRVSGQQLEATALLRWASVDFYLRSPDRSRSNAVLNIAGVLWNQTLFFSLVQTNLWSSVCSTVDFGTRLFAFCQVRQRLEFCAKQKMFLSSIRTTLLDFITGYLPTNTFTSTSQFYRIIIPCRLKTLLDLFYLCFTSVIYLDIYYATLLNVLHLSL